MKKKNIKLSEKKKTKRFAWSLTASVISALVDLLGFTVLTHFMPREHLPGSFSPEGLIALPPDLYPAPPQGGPPGLLSLKYTVAWFMCVCHCAVIIRV